MRVAILAQKKWLRNAMHARGNSHICVQTVILHGVLKHSAGTRPEGKTGIASLAAHPTAGSQPSTSIKLAAGSAVRVNKIPKQPQRSGPADLLVALNGLHPAVLHSLLRNKWRIVFSLACARNPRTHLHRRSSSSIF